MQDEKTFKQDKHVIEILIMPSDYQEKKWRKLHVE